MLFELLTGQPPFTADNLSALLFAIAHNPHPELHMLRQDLPPMFEEVLNRALQKSCPSVIAGPESSRKISAPVYRVSPPRRRACGDHPASLRRNGHRTQAVP